MNGRKHIVKKRINSATPTSLPPHTWEAHPKINSGETNKTFLIVLISIVLVIVLILFLFIGSKFVGKATQILAGQSVSLDFLEADTLRLVIDLAGSDAASGIYVELSSQTSGYSACPPGSRIAIEQGTPLWGDFKEESCTGNRRVFGDATLSDVNFKTVITYDFPVPALEDLSSVNFRIDKLDVYDSVTGADLFTAEPYNFDEVTILAAECTNEGLTRACGVAAAIGLCQPGTQTCTNDRWGACVGAVEPVAELCDGLDNDCDGNVDEAQVGSVCTTVENCGGFGLTCPQNQNCVNGECVTSAVNTCTGTIPSNNVATLCPNDDQSLAANTPLTQVAVCTAARECEYACTANAMLQNGQCILQSCIPSTEICTDAIDNDCDGTINEDCPLPQVATLQFTSTAFSNNDVIPSTYACDSNPLTRDARPALRIGNIPATARSLIVMMDDLQLAPAKVHWVMLNIPVASGRNFVEIAAGTAAVAGTTLGRNEINNGNNYAGPCPPAGENHQYRFKAYALTTASLTAANIQSLQNQQIIRAAEVEDELENIIVGEGTLFGWYPAVGVPAAEEVPVSGGGGSRCRSEWSCPRTWSYCNSTLEQSRTCNDLNRCDRKKLTKLENRSCAACEESWVCTPWNTCQNGQQTRNCVDERACRTLALKPAQQKSCQQVVDSGPPPARVQPQLPPVQQQPIIIPALPSFWNKYFWPIAGAALALLTVVLIIFGLVHAFRPKAVKPAAYNTEELKEWVQKEKQMGTSDEDIRKILSQHTGWSRGEIENLFEKPPQG